MSKWGLLLQNMGDQPLIARLVARASWIERMTLSAITRAASRLFAFAMLANAATQGSTRAFDEWLIIALRTPGDLADPIGPKWIEEMMRDFTALGSTGVLTLTVLAIAGFL